MFKSIKKFSNFINSKKEQYSDNNIKYSNRLQSYSGKRRSASEVTKMLNNWQAKQKNKPIEVEQKYYYTDKPLKFDDKVIVKKQEKIEL